MEGVWKECVRTSQHLCVCRHTKSNWKPWQPPFIPKIQSRFVLSVTRWPVRKCFYHLNNYVTALLKSEQQKQRDCDLMTGEPVKKPSWKGMRVCSRPKPGPWNLHGSSFNSRLTFSWIQKQHCHAWETSGEKEATDWLSNTKAAVVVPSWAMAVQVSATVNKRLCRINKISRGGNCSNGSNRDLWFCTRIFYIFFSFDCIFARTTSCCCCRCCMNYLSSSVSFSVKSQGMSGAFLCNLKNTKKNPTKKNRSENVAKLAIWVNYMRPRVYLKKKEEVYYVICIV